MLVAQAFLTAVAVFPIFYFVKKRLGGFAGVCFAAAYSLFWGIQLMVAYDFHELAFGVPLIAFLIYFMDEEKWTAYFVTIALLFCVKEDLCFFVAFAGIYLIVFKRKFKYGFISFFAGIVVFLLLTKYVMPYFAGGGAFHQFYYYEKFGDTPWHAFLGAVKNPALVYHEMFDHPYKQYMLKFIFNPFLWTSLLSPLTTLSVPLLAERLLSDNWKFYVVDAYYYSATIAPVLAMTAADGIFVILKFIKYRLVRQAVFAAAGLAVVWLALPLLNYKLEKLWEPQFCRLSETDKSGNKALALIPPDASVAAQDSVEPHLCNREALVRMLEPGIPDLDFIICASPEHSPWPAPRRDWIYGYIDEKMKNGYIKIFDENGWKVLEKKSLYALRGK